ncbi:MAG: beta-propeller domain-containing protein [Clostridiales bacterium]|nr:beta-propeller domain-containing protein [Clostridiales bacterium]
MKSTNKTIKELREKFYDEVRNNPLPDDLKKDTFLKKLDAEQNEKIIVFDDYQKKSITVPGYAVAVAAALFVILCLGFVTTGMSTIRLAESGAHGYEELPPTVKIVRAIFGNKTTETFGGFQKDNPGAVITSAEDQTGNNTFENAAALNEEQIADRNVVADEHIDIAKSDNIYTVDNGMIAVVSEKSATESEGTANNVKITVYSNDSEGKPVKQSEYTQKGNYIYSRICNEKLWLVTEDDKQSSAGSNSDLTGTGAFKVTIIDYNNGATECAAIDLNNCIGPVIVCECAFYTVTVQFDGSNGRKETVNRYIYDGASIVKSGSYPIEGEIVTAPVVNETESRLQIVAAKDGNIYALKLDGDMQPVWVKWNIAKQTEVLQIKFIDCYAYITTDSEVKIIAFNEPEEQPEEKTEVTTVIPTEQVTEAEVTESLTQVIENTEPDISEVLSGLINE